HFLSEKLRRVFKLRTYFAPSHTHLEGDGFLLCESRLPRNDRDDSRDSAHPGEPLSPPADDLFLLRLFSSVAAPLRDGPLAAVFARMAATPAHRSRGEGEDCRRVEECFPEVWLLPPFVSRYRVNRSGLEGREPRSEDPSSELLYRF